MGVVWAAINENTEREVAIKLILGSPKNQGLRERLLREARASGRIAHRNVVEIYDVGETEQGQPFLVMQMLRGETLASWLERAGPLPVATITAIAVDILRALIAAHAAGVVHRDLKPENVFLHQESDGFTVLKVVDFGVSKLLDSDDPTTSITGVPIGSPAYMSPEQARGDRDVGPPSDVWAVGVILFEMLAARRPFVGATSYEVVRLVQQGNAPRLSSLVPEVDPGIDDLVARCLDRTATARPSASQALEALAPFVPPGEISSRRSFQPSPSSPGLASSDAVPGASLADLAAGRATLTDSASMPAAPTASKTRPSPASPLLPESAAQDPPDRATRSGPAAHKGRSPGLFLGFGLLIALLAVLRLQALPASAGPQPLATDSAPAAPAASAGPLASSSALEASLLAAAPPAAQASSLASASPAASQAPLDAGDHNRLAGTTRADKGGPKSHAPPKPSGCPAGCRSLRGTCVDGLELPCKR
ncbi:MAG: protein kinase [Polyangiaceae bacterium]|nr:protein kinase [Polyangiaceae bacterium]